MYEFFWNTRNFFFFNGSSPLLLMQAQHFSNYSMIMIRWLNFFHSEISYKIFKTLHRLEYLLFEIIRIILMRCFYSKTSLSRC